MTAKTAPAKTIKVVEFDESNRRWKGSSQFVEMLVPIGDIHFDPENLKEHNDFNIKTIAASLKRFGQWEALIIRSDGQLVAGEGRILAVQADEGLRWTHVAAVVFDGPEKDASDLAQLLNRTPELATWDRQNLAAYLERARREEDDILSLGWREEDVTGLLASIGTLGDREVEFLGEVLPGDRNSVMSSSGGPELEGPQPRQLAFPVSEEEREEAIRLLRIAQERMGTETLSQTLLAVLRDVVLG